MNTDHELAAFRGTELVARGKLTTLLPALKQLSPNASQTEFLIFDLTDCAEIDIDWSAAPASHRPSEPEKRKRGRPKLGVTPREITLLPRQWAWLATQKGGTSAALRRIIDDAQKNDPEGDRRRLAQMRADRFMQSLAGNMPNYVEASRALYSSDRQTFESLISAWPNDVRTIAADLAQKAFAPATEKSSSANATSQVEK